MDAGTKGNLMIVNGKSLLEAAPIKNMLDHKVKHNGVSHGLSEAGYDIRIKQEIMFLAPQKDHPEWVTRSSWYASDVKMGSFTYGKFTIASAIEEFQMPTNMVGIVHDKSTWARAGLSVFNTVIEPGFNGGLTLELVYHGNTNLLIPAGSGIAQVVFTRTSDHMTYTGKYSNQSTEPTPARFE